MHKSEIRMNEKRILKFESTGFNCPIYTPLPARINPVRSEEHVCGSDILIPKIRLIRVTSLSE